MRRNMMKAAPEGVGSLLIDDDFSSYTIGTLLHGLTPPINVGTSYQRRASSGTFAGLGVSAFVIAGDLLSGVDGIEIDALQPNVRFSVVQESTINNNRYFVGGLSAINNVLVYPAYSLRILPALGRIDVSDTTNVVIATVTGLSLPVGVKITMEFDPSVRFAFLIDDVLKYELTSSVGVAIGNSHGVCLPSSSSFISNFSIESL